MTSKQRSFLRSLANPVRPIFQIGKGGINENMVVQFKDALEARELVKATVLKSAEADIREIAGEIAQLSNSEVVQVIGNKFVLYKESKDSKRIVLP